MSIPLNIATVLKQHVTLEVESIDRLYLNGYDPGLQTEGGVAHFFRHHRGQPFASSALMDPISTAFIRHLERFADAEGIPLVAFEKGQKKEAVAAAYRTRWADREGVYLIGKAQEKTRTFRTHKRRNPVTGKPYPWLYRSTAMVNHYYMYLVDADFGPLFVKFGSYFPYPVKVCLNGHEYLKRQLTKAGIAFEASDNCILACADPRRLQALADGLTAEKLERLFHKWLARLPHPFTAADRAAGYRYQLSILQAEFSLTQMLDRPQTGRLFFEQIIRDNLDLGRPDQVQLIFGRRITKRTPGRFRTRVLTTGVVPSLHVDYKRSRIKQYHKDGRALRTETTINDAHDFGIGRRLRNLPLLWQVGRHANRRLLAVQRLSHDCVLGEAALGALSRPAVVSGQRVPALRFADPRVMALFGALVLFRLLPAGFTNTQLRAHLAPLLGYALGALPRGRMSYDLRRLRLRGLIQRVPHSHRYRVTDQGFRTALFVLKVWARILRPGLAEITLGAPAGDGRLRPAFEQLEQEIERMCAQAQLVAA
jgi:hypothetical protein